MHFFICWIAIFGERIADASVSIFLKMPNFLVPENRRMRSLFTVRSRSF